MKTKILSMFAMAAMLLTTSCAKEEANEPASGEQVTASFNVQLPTGINARQAKGPKKVYADGKTATTLKYMAFDAAGNRIADVGGETTINLTTTVQLQLTTGKEYKIVFWAANASAPYTLDENGKVTINYDGMKANDESLDAFYRCYDYKAGDAVENPIKLYRPFAQLNVGTKDMEQAEKTGFTKGSAKTQVKVSGIANELNLLTGAVSGDAEVTCELNAIPTGEAFPKDGYDYLSMDYLLVGKDAKTNVDVNWEITDGANTIDRTFANVPLQGNYRTNIYGSLLTSSSDMNVEIDPAFGDEFNYSGYKVETSEELANAVKIEGAYIELAPNKHYDMPASVAQNVKIAGDPSAVIDMKNAVAWQGANASFFNVTIKYPGDNYVGIQHANSLKYQNCVFEGVQFAYANYSEYVGCTFKQDAEAYNIWTYGSKNVKFKDCKFECQGKSVLIYCEDKTLQQKVTFDNCTFSASKGSPLKAAIEIDSSLSYEGQYDVYINNCTHTGFSWNSTIYHNKKGKNANVWVDGVLKLQKGNEN